MVIQEPERQSSYLALVGVKLGITFGSGRLGDGALQEDFGTVFQFSVLVPFVKTRQCDMLKFTTHTCLSFMFWFSVFGLTDLGFS